MGGGGMMRVLAYSNKSIELSQVSRVPVLARPGTSGFPQPKYSQPFLSRVCYGSFYFLRKIFYHHPEVSVITKNSTAGRGQGIWEGHEEVLMYLRRHV